MPEVLANGRPCITYQGHAVVAADAIVLLSGVNINSVRKTLAAIQALHKFCGVPIERLVTLADIPSVPVRGDDDRVSMDRAQATRALCDDIADSNIGDEVGELLKLEGRFRLREITTM
jgi:hypothetical protein